MSKQPNDDRTLESFFAAARDNTPRPSGDLMARLEQDALAAQTALARQRPARKNRSLLEELRRSLGGWAGVAGLAAATCAGIWIGASPTLDLGTLFYGADLTGVSLDPSSGFDFMLVEG